MTIEERIRLLESISLRLESSNRRLKIGLVFLMVLAAGIVTLAMTDGETKEYSVLDASGKERARFGLVGEGASPGIVLLGKNGSKRLFIGLDSNDGPMITFLGKSGQSAFHIDVNGSSKGGPSAPLGGKSTVCYSRKDDGRTYHKCAKKGEARCSEMGDGFPRMLPLADAKKKKMRPCPVCFPDGE